MAVAAKRNVNAHKPRAFWMSIFAHGNMCHSWSDLTSPTVAPLKKVCSCEASVIALFSHVPIFFVVPVVFS